MRVVIAMDSFKGSLSSIEAGKAVAEGVRRADGAIECAVCPVADGGEGTSAALTEGLHGETVRVRVTGPLGEKVTACWMSDEDIETLCQDILPNMMNQMLSTEEVKDRLGVSEATLNRLVAKGELSNGQKKRRGHTRYWKKWDVLWFLRKKKS